MLDTISDIDYKRFLSTIMDITLNLKYDNTEEDKAFNRLQFEKLDLLLAIAIPLVSVQPVLVTIGYLRSTYMLRKIIPSWPLLLKAAEKAFSDKFKQYKVDSLLKGLRETS